MNTEKLSIIQRHASRCAHCYSVDTISSNITLSGSGNDVGSINNMWNIS